MGSWKLKNWEQQKKQSRDATLAAAEALVEKGRFDDADRTVTTADPSIQGAVALAAIYRKRLEHLVETGLARHDRRQAEEVFRRAKDWAWSCYPEPHTRIEADDYAAGRESNLATLIRILGYEPAQT